MQFSLPGVDVSLAPQPFEHQKIKNKIKATANAIIRNRKLHFLLASIAFVIAVYHAFAFQGIVIDNSYHPPFIQEYNYETASEIIALNRAVSDIRIQKCLRGFDCGVPKSRKPDAFWQKKITKLNLFSENSGIFNYFLLVEKSRLADSEILVIDIKFTSTDEQPSTTVENSKFLKRKVSSAGYIWLNYVESLDLEIPIVRDINVFFGKEDMKDSRKHWKFEPGSIPLPGKSSLEPRLSMLSVKVLDELEILKSEQEFQNVWKKNEILLSTNPKFKIMQLSDLHVGQDTEVCHEDCKFDADTFKFVESAIKKEGDVQLIVITGDLVDYRRTKHYPSALLKALSPVLESGIPFVFTFGDRDTEYGMNSYGVLDFVSSLPGSYNKRPRDLDYRMSGMTNGNLKIYDLHRSPIGSQIDVPALYSQHADALVTYLDSSWGRISDSQATYLHRLNHKSGKNTEFKLLFAHHPLPNFRPEGVAKLIGTYNEKHQIVSGTDKKILDDIKANGYKAVAVGHEHENDACVWDENDEEKILLCYSGVTGEAGRTKIDPNYKRRLRIYEFDFENNKIYSWKRDQEKIIDPQEIWAGEAVGASTSVQVGEAPVKDEEAAAKDEEAAAKDEEASAKDEEAPANDEEAPANDEEAAVEDAPVKDEN